jgi:hypothetical protein
VVPAAGENVIIRSGVTVTVAATLDLGQFGSLVIEGSGHLNIAAGHTVAVLPKGWTVYFNLGTVTTNYGFIENNTNAGTNYGAIVEHTGTLAINEGQITCNFGTTMNNTRDGSVAINRGTITSNFGIVTINQGTVTSNGLVDDQHGLVVYNAGTVTTNYGTIGEAMIADAVLDEAKGSHTGFLTTLALEAGGNVADAKTAAEAVEAKLPVSGRIGNATQTSIDAIAAALAGKTIVGDDYIFYVVAGA